MDELLFLLPSLFARCLGEEHVLPYFALPQEYLAYLMVVDGALTDDWTNFYGRGQVWRVTPGDITWYGENPVKKGRVRAVSISMPSGKEHVKLATIALNERVMWLSAGMDSEESETYRNHSRRACSAW